MNFIATVRRIWPLLVTALLLAAPAAAQDTSADQQEYRLFDRFTFTIGLSWSDVSTDLRLDSKRFGVGTDLSLEDDLGLDDGVYGIDAKFEWQFARRHRLFASWLDLSRDDQNTVTRDLQLGDLLIPVSATTIVEFDVTDWRIGYTYYPWLRERWALGISAGVRVLDIKLAAGIDSFFGDIDLEFTSEEADIVGPLPFLGFEYRYMFDQKRRFTAGAGWLEAKVGDYDGSQWIVDAAIESLVGRHWGWGASVGYSTVDVNTEDDDFRGKVELEYLTPRIFAKFHW